MGKNKASSKREPTLLIECRAGTPHELEIRRCHAEAQAKGFLLDRLRRRINWASRYNLAAHDIMKAHAQAIDSLNLGDMKVGAQRQWKATDEHSGVTFVFELEVLAK
jgi:hypothetical protein